MERPLIHAIVHENRAIFSLFTGKGTGIFAFSPDETGRSSFWYLAKKEKPTFLDAFYDFPLETPTARKTILTLFKLYCKERLAMSNERKEQYFEISNYQDVAIGYVEWEPDGKEDKSYFNDYLTIGLRTGVTREGSVCFDKDGNPSCQICGRKAKVYPTIEEAHEAMVEYLSEKLVSDALGI